MTLRGEHYEPPASGASCAPTGEFVTASKCPLSARELQIVGMVARGHTNRMIGATLGLSPLTVKSHLARIFREIGAADRAHATAICFREGWVE